MSTKGKLRKFFQFIMVILNVVAAAALGLACLCCFVNPKTIWWIGFFGLGYVHLLVVNVCFIVFWLFSRKKVWMMISTVTILLGWTFVGKNFQLFEKELPEELSEKSFKVLSFNVQGFSQRNTVQPDGEMLNIFDFLRDVDADIICMQEYAVNQWRVTELREDNVRKQLGNTPFSHTELSRSRIGIATFSKYPIINRQVVYTDGTANACICSDLLIGNDTVRVYNVHLKSVGFHDDEKDMLNNVISAEYGLPDVSDLKTMIRIMRKTSPARALQVEILSSHIAQSPYPTIICGDFNDPPISYSYRKVRGKQKDAFVEAGAGRSTTYNIGRIASLRIDYILYSDTFRAYDYESPRALLSDHFPVMCRLVKR